MYVCILYSFTLTLLDSWSCHLDRTCLQPCIFALHLPSHSCSLDFFGCLQVPNVPAWSWERRNQQRRLRYVEMLVQNGSERLHRVRYPFVSRPVWLRTWVFLLQARLCAYSRNRLISNSHFSFCTRGSVRNVYTRFPWESEDAAPPHPSACDSQNVGAHLGCEVERMVAEQ